MAIQNDLSYIDERGAAMLGDRATLIMQDLSLSGSLAEATHVGTVGEQGEGAFVRIWLLIQGEQIVRASYATHGCPSSVAASAMTARLAMGRSVSQARQISAKDVDLVLGGLPEGKGHFADMAISALNLALENRI